MAGRLTKEETISNVYYNINEGFASIQATYKKKQKKRTPKWPYKKLEILTKTA